MSNAIRCIDKGFAVTNSGISCLALIFNLSNSRMTNLPAKNCLRLRDMKSHIQAYALDIIGCYSIGWDQCTDRLSAKQNG